MREFTFGPECQVNLGAGITFSGPKSRLCDGALELKIKFAQVLFTTRSRVVLKTSPELCTQDSGTQAVGVGFKTKTMRPTVSALLRSCRRRAELCDGVSSYRRVCSATSAEPSVCTLAPRRPRQQVVWDCSARWVRQIGCLWTSATLSR